MVEPPREVSVGLRFRVSDGDEQVLWQVREPLLHGYWECEGLNEPYVIEGEQLDSDYAGQRRAFHETQILQALRIDSLFGVYNPANYEPQTREVP